MDTKNKEKPLTPDARKTLMDHFAGYDISPDMVRLSKVNLYLHGFPSPTIFEYDTLSSEEKWDENFDVMLANPPFMSPSGGIRPHKRFSVQANRSEVLFVDYILEHLRPNGRAGIIVPEGVIGIADNAYKQLRKLLVEDGLYAIVSLPSGVFNPYSGVRTYIFFFDNQLAKRSKEMLFIKILNDGFNLGAQRRPIDRNDLPYAVKVLKAQQDTIKTGKKNPLLKKGSLFAWVVPKSKILENRNHDLSGDRYLTTADNTNAKWQMAELGEVLDYEQPTKYIVRSVDYDDSYSTPVLTAGKTFILGYTNEKDGVFKEELPVIIFDDFTTAIKLVDFPFKVKSSAMKILHAKKDKADIKFLFYVMQKIKFVNHKHKRYWISEYSKIKIPLPPLEAQKEIVEQIEVKQNAINAAKAVIDNLERERRYFGQSLRKIKGVEWVELGELLENVKYTNKIQKPDFKRSGKFPIIDQSQNFIAGHWDREKDVFSIKKPVVIFGDHTRAIKYVDFDFVLGADGVKILQPNDKIISKLLYFILLCAEIKNLGYGRHFKELVRVKIPLLPLEIQKQLVAEMEEQEKIIEANKKLVGIMEQKITEVLSEI